ncbi:MAG: hypothetical protein EOO41_04400 [Methanobacteriota archaeon]|nr:MAG: hypothetical protein EOO41_04400 [Euryarchaeota archaeon]
MPADEVTANEVVCTSPPSSTGAGLVSVQVTTNSQDSAMWGVQFTYYEQPTVLQLLPHITPAEGGGLISVVGLNFQNFASAQSAPALDETASSDVARTSTAACATYLCCRIGRLTVPALFVSSQVVRCPVPTFRGLPSLYNVTISIVGALALNTTAGTLQAPSLTNVLVWLRCH